MELADRPRFGELLRHYRLDAGLTQQGLAERSDLSVEAIGLLEREGRTRPQRETVSSLVRALVLSPERESLLRSALHVARTPRRPRGRGSSGSATLSVVRAETAREIPRQRTSFVGRQRELSDVLALLEGHRLVTIVGAGGVGKTRLAMRLAADALESYPDGVCLAELASLEDEALVASAVLTALQLFSTTGAALEAVLAYLRPRRLLLILDNCEHLMGHARNVAAQIVASCPSMRILATSREPLRLADEHSFRLPSLESPPDSCRTAREAVSYNTVKLFVDRALSVDPTFALTDQNTPFVAEICRRLDGIPFAIELAAARVATLAPRQIAERLDRRFRLLARENPSALPRHRTMKALIDWSYDLLTSREQNFFDRLSVFSGGCSLEAATAVCALTNEDDLDVLDLISSLVSKSLLVAECVGEVQRYRLLESPRQYARDKLIARGEYEQAARRHALVYLDAAERLERESDAMPDRVWAQHRVELENWRAALDWALGKRRDVAVGQRLASARKLIWRTFPLVEGRRWVRAAIVLTDERTPPDLIARLYHAEAEGAHQFGEREASLAAAQRALAKYREIGDSAGGANAQTVAAAALVLIGRTKEAEPLLREALETARALGDRRLAAQALHKIGWICCANGDFAGARARVGEALRLARLLGAEWFEASVTASLAEIEFHAGDSEAALRLTEDVLTSLRTLNFPPAAPGLATTLINMATYLIASGRYEEASSHANEALELARGLQLFALACLSLRLLALAVILKPQEEGRRTSAQYAGAARLFGFLEVHLRGMEPKEYGLRSEHDRALTLLRGTIPADALTHLMADGASMIEDEAIEQARAIQ